MKSLRKLVIAVVIGLGVLIPMASTQRAEANTSMRRQQYHILYYRVCPDSPWVVYGYCSHLSDARTYANWIQNAYGYETFIR
jgi:hypothetical protein